MRNVTLLTNAHFGKLGQSLEPIALPHTWNNLDGQDGGNDYWRGIGIYTMDLPTPTKGRFMTQGNLTYASMLTTLRDMMGFYTIRMVCRDATPKQLAQLNRLLSRVKK